MTKPVQYEIIGYYFGAGENRGVNEVTHLHYDGGSSMIDHQKMWYDEAMKSGHASGELDEARIIRANYHGHITEEQMVEIVNDGRLMDTPFRKLFPDALNAYIRESSSLG